VRAADGGCCEGGLAVLAIRVAISADAPAISALIQSLAHLFFALPSGEGAEKFTQSMQATPLQDFIQRADINYWLGEDDGQFCGVVAVREHKHLQHLFVVPAYQGRGIGKALWLHARAYALKAGNSGVFTVNASMNAVAVYERFGFAATGAAIVANGLRFVPMQLKLTESTNR
jgi:GNAT superfamily N-acetyltransferase